MTAPTEQEIREAIAEGVRQAVQALPDSFRGENALDAILDSDMALTRRGWADGFYPADDHAGTLWADLTEAEAKELNQVIHDAYDPMLTALADRIIESVVAAAVAFGQRHPDIPRGSWRPEPEPIPA